MTGVFWEKLFMSISTEALGGLCECRGKVGRTNGQIVCSYNYKSLSVTQRTYPRNAHPFEVNEDMLLVRVKIWRQRIESRNLMERDGRRTTFIATNRRVDAGQCVAQHMSKHVDGCRQCCLDPVDPRSTRSNNGPVSQY